MNSFNISVTPTAPPTTLSDSTPLPPPSFAAVRRNSSLTSSPTFSYCPVTTTQACVITLFENPVSWPGSIYQATTFTNATEYSAFASYLSSSLSAHPCPTSDLQPGADENGWDGCVPFFTVAEAIPSRVIPTGDGGATTLSCCDPYSAYSYYLPDCTGKQRPQAFFATVTATDVPVETVNSVMDGKFIGANTCSTVTIPYQPGVFFSQPPRTKTFVPFLAPAKSTKKPRHKTTKHPHLSRDTPKLSADQGIPGKAASQGNGEDQAVVMQDQNAEKDFSPAGNRLAGSSTAGVLPTSPTRRGELATTRAPESAPMNIAIPDDKPTSAFDNLPDAVLTVNDGLSNALSSLPAAATAGDTRETGLSPLGSNKVEPSTTNKGDVATAVQSGTSSPLSSTSTRDSKGSASSSRSFESPTESSAATQSHLQPEPTASVTSGVVKTSLSRMHPWAMCIATLVILGNLA